MGKAAKVIVPVAAIGLGIWATGGIGASGWLYNTSTLSASFIGPSTLAQAPGLLQMAGGGLGSLFSSGFSGGFGSPASMALSGLSAISNLAAASARSDDARLRQQEEARRMRLIRLQALQTEARALKEQGAAKGAAIAKAVAQHQDISGRSFLAFMEDEEAQYRQQIDTIKVNAEAGIQTSQLRIRQYGLQEEGAIWEGVGGAARSLLTARA
jgi:hypothetical protein